jgi:hypothetical protein
MVLSRDAARAGAKDPTMSETESFNGAGPTEEKSEIRKGRGIFKRREGS